MSKMAIFHGSVTALVTPFEGGMVDFEWLRALVDWQIESGTHGLVPVGTTGESPTLSHEEHGAVITATIKAARGRIPGRTTRAKRSRSPATPNAPGPTACWS
jgi:4-hydroxy-tetrahydrodipicolinate synthase